MEHKILPKIGAVFVPVSDIERSITWYCNLLKSPEEESTHDNKIYSIELENNITIILDANKPVKNSSQPLFYLFTENIQMTRQYLVKNAIEIILDVVDIGSLKILSFKDPDDNQIMVAEKNP